ncbi:MAG: hypothetical protein KatS3mg011_2085 [Acidimicrobiia bacterium]|nr:MAG: hypothetical protein KatS3mg011_2085 [Acidimicrobiia bacterium]
MGVVTFLFTDLEGSTRLWEKHPEAMREALAVHDRLLEDLVEEHGGRIFKHTGDGICAVFDSAGDALEASADIQRRFADETLPEVGRLRLRIGVHAGEAEERDGDFFGTALNRTARLMSAAHGGQALVSLVAARLADDARLQLRDLGEHRLRDLGRPERVFQLVVDGLPHDFLPIRTLDHARPPSAHHFLRRARPGTSRAGKAHSWSPPGDGDRCRWFGQDPAGPPGHRQPPARVP